MLLRFPTIDVLKLAITSGAIPAEVVVAPLRAGWGETGDIWIDTSHDLPGAARTALLHLGAEFPLLQGAPLDQSLVCWFQIFAASPATEALETGDRTPVLFDLQEAEQLPVLVAEILRQGNDRQGFCHVQCGDRVRTLLRVVGPPYYSLLRAIDRRGAGALQFHAYVERRPRVWIQIGFAHPMADRIVPPPGQLLLMRSPRSWDFVDECPMQDIYKALDCRIPRAEVSWTPAQLPARLEVPLRLVPGGDDAAELWVLGHYGEEQISALVQGADDQLLSRLAFAVGECSGQSAIILRVRPSKHPAPVLVIEGLPLRPYLKLPNLFVPCGWRVHPPLRRSTLAQILSPEPARITWLAPADSGHFTPHTLADSAFRPLSDWVDYILDRDHVPLQAWIDANRFDFESFVCRDDEQDDRREREEKRPKQKPDDGEKPQSRALQSSKDAPVELPSPEQGSRFNFSSDQQHASVVAPVPTDRELSQKRLFELEQNFLKLESPLDAADRIDIWREMAHLNSALGRHVDAGLCCASVVWDDDNRMADVGPIWETAAHEGPNGKLDARRIDDVLSVSNPSIRGAHASAVINFLVVAASSSLEKVAIVAERRGPLARFLEHHEGTVPVRIAWLGWHALYRVSGGDVLALARARDRALERLFAQGLQADLDMPSFLRGLGRGESQQLHLIRTRFAALRERVMEWIREPLIYKHSRTRQYAALMFCYGMARLGDTAGCRELLAAIEPQLGRDSIHSWTWEAYGFRIRQAVDARPNQGPLPPELLEVLEPMDRQVRYKIDKLRQISRILEPSLHIDAYRSWRQYRDDFTRDVKMLVDLNDPEQMKGRIERLFAQVHKDPQADEAPAREAALLTAALSMGPRLGDVFTSGLLDRVMPLVVRKLEPADEQPMLQRAIFAAAHFDRSDYVEAFLGRIGAMLQERQSEGTAETLAHTLGECFRSLRKLGMRDEIGRLLSRISSVANDSGPKVASGEDRLRLLLLVSSAWLFFGQQNEALGTLNEAREQLAGGDLKPDRRVSLAQSYLSALSYAPAEFALPRIEELFQHRDETSESGFVLPFVSDPLTTSSHFSVFQLRIVESLVLAVASEEFAMNSDGRRWLDEDEFIVRRRIHRDMRAASNNAFC